MIFFSLSVFERFLLLFPLFLLSSGFILSLSKLFKLKIYEMINKIILSILFLHFLFIFFYINKEDKIAGFYLNRFDLFFFILILNLIFYEKIKKIEHFLLNIISLICALTIIFFNNIFLIFLGIITYNVILKLFLFKKINYKNILIIIFLLFFLILNQFLSVPDLNKFLLFICIILFLSFSFLNPKEYESIQENQIHFFIYGILQSIIFFKIMTIEWKDGNNIFYYIILSIFVIFFVKNLFYSLTEENFSKFLFYEINNNIYFLYILLLAMEIEKKIYISFIILIFFVILFAIQLVKIDKDYTITFIKYKSFKLKENFEIMFFIFLNLFLNFYFFYILFSFIKNHTILKTIVLLALLIWFIDILNKIFLFFSILNRVIINKKKFILNRNHIFFIIYFIFYLVLYNLE